MLYGMEAHMPVKKKNAESAPSHEAIEKRARAIYEERLRKNEDGSAEADWLKAEKELLKAKKT